jgi:hypothetical protein
VAADYFFIDEYAMLRIEMTAVHSSYVSSVFLLAGECIRIHYAGTNRAEELPWFIAVENRELADV